MPRESPELAFAPLTPDRWGDVETLFGERGACGGCWCMFWRRERKDFDAGKGAGNKAAMRSVVEREIPGILAYTEGAPVGWCAGAPRETYLALGRSRILKAVDTAPVWSVSCLFVAKPYRGCQAAA